MAFMKSKVQMRRFRFFAYFAVTLCLFGLLTRFIYNTSVFRPMLNFHEVDPGKFYRSAQMTPTELREAIKQYGIRTVINLRGDHHEDAWYTDEQSLLKSLGVRMVDVSFSTYTVPPPKELKKYVETIINTERPILVHCRAGADRTGEASAIYAMEFMDQSREQALEQLSLRYLHVSYFQPAQRVLIENYQGLRWVEEEYSPCSPLFFPYAAGQRECVTRQHFTGRKAQALKDGWSGTLWQRVKSTIRQD